MQYGKIRVYIINYEAVIYKVIHGKVNMAKEQDVKRSQSGENDAAVSSRIICTSSGFSMWIVWIFIIGWHR